MKFIFQFSSSKLHYEAIDMYHRFREDIKLFVINTTLTKKRSASSRSERNPKPLSLSEAGTSPSTETLTPSDLLSITPLDSTPPNEKRYKIVVPHLNLHKEQKTDDDDKKEK